MKIDLHNHTVLCNHAEGTMQEYIDRAIELGIDVYGFSEHAPIKNSFDEKYRLSMDDKERYETSLLQLQEQYQDKIKIVLGYEVDFIEGYLEDAILQANVDYLIGSVHFINQWGFDNPEFIGGYKDKDIDMIWKEYFKAVEKMAQSQRFDIVGHLDLIKVFKYYPKQSITEIAQDAIQAIKEADMAVEINAAGFRKPVGEQYPSRELLKMCYHNNIDITFSSDAHAVDQVGLNYQHCIDIAKEIGYDSCVYYENRKKVRVAL
jgi:histidinol-phosphatase (PHP family)